MKNTGLHQKNTSFLALPVDGLLEKKQTKTGALRYYHQYHQLHVFEIFLNAFGER